MRSDTNIYRYFFTVLLGLVISCTPKNGNTVVQSATSTIDEIKWSLDKGIITSTQIKGRKLDAGDFSDVTMVVYFENDVFIFNIQDDGKPPIFNDISFKVKYDNKEYERDIIIEKNILKIHKELVAPFLLENAQFELTFFDMTDLGAVGYFFDLRGNNFSETWSQIGETAYIGLPIEKLNFRIREFVDDFGDYTGEKYIYSKYEGTFSNSATKNSKAFLYWIITERPYIFIREYREDSSKATYIGYVRIRIRDRDGEDYYKRFEGTDIYRGNIFLGDWILPVLEKEGNIRIRIEEEYGSEYAFDINIDGFNEIYSSIFPPN